MSTEPPQPQEGDDGHRSVPEQRSDPEPQTLPEQSAGGDNAAKKFRDQVAAKQAGLDELEQEDDLWSGGYSPKAMVGTWAGMVIVSIAILILAILWSSFGIWMALGIIFVLWIVTALLYAWRRLGVHYQLTTQRFIHQTGILTRKTDRIEVIDIDDVSYTQGPVQRAFGVGTITLTGSDRTHPELSMIGIAKVKEVAGLIDDIRRTERRRRSLHIEAI